jgi:excisionase family DNA binding protein
MKKPKLLTVKEAAQMIDGLTEFCVRRMCADGTLPCLKSGKKYLINQNVLLKTIGEYENIAE